MRTTAIALAIAALLSAAAFCGADAASGNAHALDFLAGGTWHCTTHMPRKNGRAGPIQSADVTFEHLSGNTLHGRFLAHPFMGDQYYGYQNGKWWAVGSENLGDYIFQTSTDAKTFSGTFGGVHGTTHLVDSYHRASVNELHIHEVDGTGPGASSEDTTCVRL